MAGTRIDTVAGRERLKPRTEPYWVRLSTGCHLGFRRMTSGSTGTWVVKFREGDSGKRAKESLGSFDDLPPNERYDAAKAAAENWFARRRTGVIAKEVTVKKICENYVAHLRAADRDSTADDAAARFKRWVNDAKIGRITLQKLKPGDVEAWRNNLATTPAQPQDKRKQATRARSKASLNRDMTALRAALNLALEDGHVPTDIAWRSKLKPVRGADGRRDVYLDQSQRRALISKAPADLAAFMRALSQVPLRPGAMAGLTVADFDKRLATLRIGKDKVGKDRKITLPSATAAFFDEQANDKLPAAPLLSRADGKPWDKDSWKKPLKEAVRAAELPTTATAYALRHSTITDLIALHRLDTLTVAQLSGTSLSMIEKHYGHLLREHAAKALESLAI